MKNLFKKIIMVAIVIIVLVTIIGIVMGDDEAITIQFDYDTYIENNTVYIEGETNLLDGAIIHYEVDTLDEFGNEYFDGNIIVEDNSFYKEIDISIFEGEEIEVWLGFQPFSQPEDIQAEYGEWGDNLEGEAVEYQKADWLEDTDGYNEIWSTQIINR